MLLLSIFVFWFFSNTFICDEVARFWEVEAKNIETIKETYDVGIVLGGISEYDFHHNMINFNKYADRLIFTEQLFHKGIIKKILISGGSGTLLSGKYKESIAIKKHLINNGITEKDIIIEDSSRNTKENVFNTAKILNKDFQDGNFLLITSANHIRRSARCFEKVGLKVAVFPTDNTNSARSFDLSYLILPNSETFEKWESIIHEMVGYIIYEITF